jgi:hypothetical protein
LHNGALNESIAAVKIAISRPASAWLTEPAIAHACHCFIHR